MPSLHRHLEHLATSFCTGLLRAVVNAPLEELAAEGLVHSASNVRPLVLGKASRVPSGQRLARRGSEEIAALADRIVATVRTRKKHGMRAEDIRAELGIAKNEWARPLAEALSSKKLRKVGRKRATTYFAA